MKELLEKLSKVVLTGSRRFKVESKESDYDLCILNDDIIKIVQDIDRSTIIKEDSGKNQDDCRPLKNSMSIAFKLDDKVINLISYPTIEALNVIEKINVKMCLLDKEDLEDKTIRYRLFELYCDKYITNDVLGLPEEPKEREYNYDSETHSIDVDSDEIPF